MQELLPLWRTPDDYEGTSGVHFRVTGLSPTQLLVVGKAAECIETYNRFVSHIQELNLVDVGNEKPVLTVLTTLSLGPVAD